MTFYCLWQLKITKTTKKSEFYFYRQILLSYIEENAKTVWFQADLALTGLENTVSKLIRNSKHRQIKRIENSGRFFKEHWGQTTPPKFLNLQWGGGCVANMIMQSITYNPGRSNKQRYEDKIVNPTVGELYSNSEGHHPSTSLEKSNNDWVYIES